MTITLGFVQQSPVSSGGGFVYERGVYERVLRAAERANFEFRQLDVPRGFGPGAPRSRASRGAQFLSNFLGAGVGKASNLLFPSQWNELAWDRWLREQGVDIVYFASPNVLALNQKTVPFISTLWDLGHRDLPEFPEFEARAWDKREALYKVSLPRSFHVFTDSKTTGLSIERHYGVRSDRWSPLGLSFPQVGGNGFIPTHEVPGEVYFLYPAKRWPHKNHLVLIDAMEIVREKLPGARLVFTGSPGGGGAEAVSRRIVQLGLQESVVDYGFIDLEMVDLLMRKATALVMPSFLGPTNIPPLHALAVGTPAIVSDVHVFDSAVQNRMVSVPPTEPALWAEEMIKSAQRKRTPPLLPDTGKQEEILVGVLRNFRERSRRWH